MKLMEILTKTKEVLKYCAFCSLFAILLWLTLQVTILLPFLLLLSSISVYLFLEYVGTQAIKELDKDA